MSYISYISDENNINSLHAPVAVSGSDLVLTRALDKEGVNGPSSFAVNVRCRRRKMRKSAISNERRPDVALKGNKFYARR